MNLKRLATTRTFVVGAVVACRHARSRGCRRSHIRRLRPQGGAGGLPGGRGREARRDDTGASGCLQGGGARAARRGRRGGQDHRGAGRRDPRSGSSRETSSARTASASSGRHVHIEGGPRSRRRGRLPRPDRGGAPRTASQRRVARRDREGRRQVRRRSRSRRCSRPRRRGSTRRSRTAGSPRAQRDEMLERLESKIDDTGERRALPGRHGPGFGHRFGGPMDGAFVPLAPPDA